MFVVACAGALPVQASGGPPHRPRYCPADGTGDEPAVHLSAHVRAAPRLRRVAAVVVAVVVVVVVVAAAVVAGLIASLPSPSSSSSSTCSSFMLCPASSSYSFMRSRWWLLCSRYLSAAVVPQTASQVAVTLASAGLGGLPPAVNASVTCPGALAGTANCEGFAVLAWNGVIGAAGSSSNCTWFPAGVGVGVMSALGCVGSALRAFPINFCACVLLFVGVTSTVGGCRADYASECVAPRPSS
jgi:hypothetical protein